MLARIGQLGGKNCKLGQRDSLKWAKKQLVDWADKKKAHFSRNQMMLET
jgi:hypothetical protein